MKDVFTLILIIFLLAFVFAPERIGESFAKVQKGFMVEMFK